MISEPEMEPTICYRLNGIPHYPHYTKQGVYSCPGGGTIKEDELVERGAEQFVAKLWVRRYNDPIEALNLLV